MCQMVSDHARSNVTEADDSSFRLPMCEQLYDSRGLRWWCGKSGPINATLGASGSRRPFYDPQADDAPSNLPIDT
jgi:hypothetical protein